MDESTSPECMTREEIKKCRVRQLDGKDLRCTGILRVVFVTAQIIIFQARRDGRCQDMPDDDSPSDAHIATRAANKSDKALY